MAESGRGYRMKIYNSGAELTASMKANGHDAMADLWYIGQEAFFVNCGGCRVIFDPYLTDFADYGDQAVKERWVRNYPVPLDPNTLDFLDYIIISHDHLDHLDPRTIAMLLKASPDAIYIVPEPIIGALINAGVNRSNILGGKEGEERRIKGAAIIPVGAWHDMANLDENGLYKDMSFIVRFDNGITLLHGGDMTMYPELPQKLRKHRIDIALLPINGGDYKRDTLGIIGNINFREAADLADIINADLTIPMHFDMYGVNEENPAFFVDYMSRVYTDRKYHIFKVGERFTYVKEQI